MIISWPKWFQASIQKHLIAVAATLPITAYVEGEDRQTDDKLEFVEIRTNGPDILQVSKNVYRIDVLINVVITVKRSIKNTWRRHELSGIFMNAMTPEIDIYRLGNSVEDDKSKFTCLPLRNDLSESMGVQFRDLGRLQTAADLTQTMLQGTYRISNLQGD